MAVIGSADIVIRAITKDFDKDVKKALKSVNTGGGGGGKNAFSKIGDDAEKARLKFNKLIKTGYALAPAISGAVGAVGDLAMGLFAVGSAVGAATPALVVLPGILSAVAQAGIAAKLAFAGVGKAISALMKQKTSGGGGTNDNAVADARKRLAKAYQTAADQMAAANDKVRKAQEKLNNAYKEGAESLQQLGFDSEEAALAQKQAAIELERARETLARAAGAGVNSRAYREAELALQQADLDYRKATDTVNDLAVEQEYAARTGIEGTREVIDATNDLAEAEADRAKTLRDTNQDIADAQEALTRVLNSGGSSSSSDALAGLSAEAKAFAQFIVDLQPEFQKLKAAAGRMLFPLLQTSIQTLVDDLFPRLIPKLELTGRALGKVAEDFANTITSADNMKRIDSILGNNVGVISNLGGAAVNLAEAFLIILDAAGPLITKFSEWVELTTAGWTETLKAKDATGELGDIFTEAGDKAATIGGVLKTTFGAFFELGKGAEKAGMKIITAFGGAMEKLKAFAQAGNTDGMFSEGERGASSLETKFDKIADNFITIGKFAGELAKALFDVSGNPGIKTFFESIMGLPATFAEVANNVNSVMGEKFGDFVSELGTLIAKFTETGGMSIFFDILTGALKIVNALFSNPVIAAAFSLLAAVKGISLAFGVIGTVSKFATNAAIGNLNNLKTVVGKVTLGLGMMKQGFTDAKRVGSSASAPALTNIAALVKGTLTGDLKTISAAFGVLNDKFIALGGAATIGLGPFLLIAGAIAAVGFIIYKAYESSEIFRTAVSNLVTAVGGALKDAMATINDAISQVMPSFTGVSDIFKTIGDFVGTYLVPIFQVILVGAINILAGVISGLIKIVGGILKAFKDPVEGVKLILSGFIDFFKSFFITPLTNALKIADIFGLLPDGFKKAINRMIRMWNDFELELKIPSNPASKLLGIDGKGFTISTPNVPLLAKGGIVPSTPGGMLAIIGEAGRRERVEPLDPSGMSSRDKALIDEMIKSRGGRAPGEGIVFNIYPSQGMNEIELANMVSRKVAWNLRIGA